MESYVLTARAMPIFGVSTLGICTETYAWFTSINQFMQQQPFYI